MEKSKETSLTASCRRLLRSLSGKARILLFSFVLAAFSLSQSGCILVPFIDSFKESGVTRADRERLLQQTVSDFQRERFWGNGGGALSFAEGTSREELREIIRDSRRSEKIVESEIEFIDFDKDAYKAQVDVIVKYYVVPQYVVQERIENQQWRFSFTDGWRFHALEVSGAPVNSTVG